MSHLGYVGRKPGVAGLFYVPARFRERFRGAEKGVLTREIRPEEAAELILPDQICVFQRLAKISKVSTAVVNTTDTAATSATVVETQETHKKRARK